MKRKAKIFFSTLATIALLTSIGGAAQKPVKGVSKVDYKFVINGEGVDSSKYLVMSKNNTTYVPLRFISEKLGASVDFSQGIISIQMMSTPSRPVVPTDTQKIQELEKKLGLVLKENSELRSKLEKADQKLEDKNIYKSLPIELETEDQFKIKINRLANDERDRSTFYVTFINTGDNNVFYVRPELTSVVIEGKSYTLSNYSARLSSTLAARYSKLGDSSLSGKFDIPKVDIENARGSITIYYDVNNSNTRKSQTIYFQN